MLHAEWPGDEARDSMHAHLLLVRPYLFDVMLRGLTDSDFQFHGMIMIIRPHKVNF